LLYQNSIHPYSIDHILPELKKAVFGGPAVVLQAPPGSGKTTRVPLALLKAMPSDHRRIVMIEPRRIAAVAAAVAENISSREIP
jgi:ATP-dependent helicase HrpB